MKGAKPGCGEGGYKGANVKESKLNKGGDMSPRGGRGTSPTKTMKVVKGK
jgi:hypothetical protein